MKGPSQEKENRGCDILGVSVPPQGQAPPQFFQKETISSRRGEDRAGGNGVHADGRRELQCAQSGELGEHPFAYGVRNVDAVVTADPGVEQVDDTSLLRLPGEFPAQKERHPGVGLNIGGQAFKGQGFEPVWHEVRSVVDQNIEFPGPFERAFDKHLVFIRFLKIGGECPCLDPEFFHG